jgi:lipase maturation factor 1
MLRHLLAVVLLSAARMAGAGLTILTAASGTYVLSVWLFLRLLGFIYLAAFLSLAVQLKGLVGSRGILPANDFIAKRKRFGMGSLHRDPTLFWINSSDNFLVAMSWTGVVLSVFLVIGFAPLPMLIFLWILYLSLFTVGRIFLGYQWDVLLLETGFLAIFLAPLELAPQFPPKVGSSPIILWLLWWLLFRLMFSSGMVKLNGGDSAWRNLTALCVHYQTQPLPTPPAWHSHQLPVRFHQFSTAVMFVIELGAPFLIIGPQWARNVAAVLFIFLMILIELTGNYAFFNLLAVALSIVLLDDKTLAPMFRWFSIEAIPPAIIPCPAFMNWIAVVVAIVILTLSLLPAVRLFQIKVSWPRWLENFFERLEPFRLVNSYGLFSVMTIERPEIIVEGSDDANTWRAYEFQWKPGDVKRPPRFVAPHQPRLDWQMWFAALGYYPNHPWVRSFLIRLLEGSPEVLSLLKTNPFPNKPPRYIRCVIYDYRFTNRAERRATKACWKAERRGLYCPILEL